MFTVLDTMLEILFFFYKTPSSGQSLGQKMLKTALRLMMDSADPVLYGFCNINVKVLQVRTHKQALPERTRNTF